MKNYIYIAALLISTLSFSQAYNGQDDFKFQVGANFQSEGTGVMASFDYGIGENISIGVSSIYLLGVTEFSEEVAAVTGDNTAITFADAEFLDRYDIRFRFNANLSNVINISPAFDLYPGLDLGLKNFGGHLGARYFFTDGFGVFTELNVPFAKYKKEEDIDLIDRPRKELNNQFNVSFGASFNI